ncbi:unnamed protein product [Bemisia tabaci]|uniref:Uncharacterized protein n=1 Tax=Bemisia tabaci TaxID=7038 RepID=A0A9P0AMP6_BEMTA|nr:unnamed protein product [Bemisia tabaci]
MEALQSPEAADLKLDDAKIEDMIGIKTDTFFSANSLGYEEEDYTASIMAIEDVGPNATLPEDELTNLLFNSNGWDESQLEYLDSLLDSL